MTYQPQADIRNFMEVCGQLTNNTPTIPDEDTLKLRASLLFEEALEFIEAAGLEVHLDDDSFSFIKVSEPNIVEMCDALTDINYVSYGAANTLGVDLSKCHDEVHRSNMSKLDENGLPIKRADGKILKSQLYSRPDLLKVLKEQGYIENGQ